MFIGNKDYITPSVVFDSIQLISIKYYNIQTTKTKYFGWDTNVAQLTGKVTQNDYLPLG